MPLLSLTLADYFAMLPPRAADTPPLLLRYAPHATLFAIDATFASYAMPHYAMPLLLRFADDIISPYAAMPLPCYAITLILLMMPCAIDCRQQGHACHYLRYAIPLPGAFRHCCYAF